MSFFVEHYYGVLSPKYLDMCRQAFVRKTDNEIVRKGEGGDQNADNQRRDRETPSTCKGKVTKSPSDWVQESSGRATFRPEPRGRKPLKLHEIK